MPAKITIGELVIPTEGPMAGILGRVDRIHRANRFYAVAEVFFGAGYGSQIVRMDWLRVADIPEPAR